MRAWALVALVLLVPQAAASDPFEGQDCADSSTCIGPGTCTPFACVPRSCQPLLFCHGEISSTRECADNVTIEGRTCQLVVGAGARPNTPGNDAWLAVAFTEGHVDAFHLPNTWVSPAIEGSFTAGGVHLGTFSVGLYRSVITTDREWTQVALVAHQDQGVAGSERVSVGVRLLDSMPEDCYAQTSRSTLARCPSQRELMESLP